MLFISLRDITGDAFGSKDLFPTEFGKRKGKLAYSLLSFTKALSHKTHFSPLLKQEFYYFNTNSI